MKYNEAVEKGYIAPYSLTNGFHHLGDVVKCPYCQSDNVRKYVFDRIEHIETEHKYHCENCDVDLGHHAYGDYEYYFLEEANNER